MISPELLKLREEYITHESQIANHTTEQKRILAILQSKCDHSLIAEIPYQPMEFSNAIPPKRICEICAYEEEGWGSGYNILKANDRQIRQVDKDTFSSFRKPIQDISVLVK